MYIYIYIYIYMYIYIERERVRERVKCKCSLHACKTNLHRSDLNKMQHIKMPRQMIIRMKQAIIIAISCCELSKIQTVIIFNFTIYDNRSL